MQRRIWKYVVGWLIPIGSCTSNPAARGAPKRVDYLDERGFKYQQVNVLRDTAAFQQMKDLSGQRLTPTLSIDEGDLLLADFDTGQLEKFLKKHDLKPG